MTALTERWSRRPTAFGGARTALAFFAFITYLSSIYAVLAYVPVTYENLIRSPLIPALPKLFRYQAVTYVVALVWVLLAWWGDPRMSGWKKKILVIAYAGVGAWLLWQAPLATTQREVFSAWFSVIVLLPLMAFLLFIYDPAQAERWQTELAELRVTRVAGCALFVVGMYFASTGAFIRFSSGHWPSPQIGRYLLVSALLQVGIAVAVTTALVLLGRTKYTSLTIGAMAVWIAVLFRFVLLKQIPFTARLSYVYGLVMGTTLALHLLAVTARTEAVNEDRSRLPRAVVIGAAALLIFLVPRLLRDSDWNEILQRMLTILIWVLLLSVWKVSGRAQKAAVSTLLGALLVATGTVVVAQRALNQVGTGTGKPISMYWQLDPSYSVARDLVSWLQPPKCDAFCVFLQQNSDVSWSFTMPNVVVHAHTDRRPFNIFIVVVDNLRQDATSPYTPEIPFTPRLQEFANDATVFQRAFTRYDGTSLSELALWSGTSLVHQQNPPDFNRINVLDKLTRAYGFHRYVTFDEILRNQLVADASTYKLDADAESWMKYDFCKTQAELLRNMKDGSEPVFFYSQPKNVHGVTLMLQTGPVPPRRYPGLPPRYQHAIEQVDGCFGIFLDALKRAGLYDESLIVFTSDHGDNAGDIGRMGHGLYLAPSEIKVPLIIHLPKSLRSMYFADPRKVAYVSDITPTIGHLLGARVEVPSSLYGRALFTAAGEHSQNGQGEVTMIQSSYFPVFGIIDANGDTVYIDNANTGERALYDLRVDPKGMTNILDPGQQEKYQDMIRKRLLEVNSWYHVRNADTGWWNWWLRN
jgi:arylsulfatase A-like enzyme